MLCKKCGTQIESTTTFCPKCGAANAAAKEVSMINGATYTVEAVNNRKPFFKRYWGALAAGAAVIAIGAGIGIYYYNTQKNRPIAAFALAAENLQDDSKCVNSGALTMEMDGLFDAGFEFEVNPDEQYMYMYGEMTIVISDYYEDEDMEIPMDMAMCVEGDEGYIAVGYMGSYEVQDLSDYTDPEEIWASYDKEPEEMDWQELLEDADLDRELEEYIDVSQINDIVERMADSLASSKNRKRIEDALQLSVTKENGVRTYSAVLTGEGILDTADILVELFETAAGNAIEGDWLEDAKDELEDAREDDEVEDELLKVSYSIKNDRFTNISLLSGDDMEEEFEIVIDYTYDGKSLKDMEFAMSGDMEGEAITFTMSLTDLNNVTGVKDSIPDDILEQMDMD